MKDYLFSLLVFLAGTILSSPPLYGQGLLVLTGSGPNSGAPAPTYLLQEDFEGTGTASGWSNTSTPDWDYAAAPIIGAQSWLGDASTKNSAYTTLFTATSPCYAFVAMTLAASGTNGTLIWELRSSSGTLAALQLRAAGQLRIAHGTTEATTTDYPGAGTYYIWLDYTAGTGANGTLELRYATTQTRPASASATITTGTSTAGIEAIVLRGLSSNVIADKLRVDDVTIGSSPP